MIVLSGKNAVSDSVTLINKDISESIKSNITCSIFGLCRSIELDGNMLFPVIDNPNQKAWVNDKSSLSIFHVLKNASFDKNSFKGDGAIYNQNTEIEMFCSSLLVGLNDFILEKLSSQNGVVIKERISDIQDIFRFFGDKRINWEKLDPMIIKYTIRTKISTKCKDFCLTC